MKKPDYMEFKLPNTLKDKYLKKKLVLSEDDMILFLKYLSEPLEANMALKAAKTAYFDMLKEKEYIHKGENYSI